MPIFETVVADCPYCHTKLDIRMPVTTDNLVQCSECGKTSLLTRNITGTYSLQPR